MNTILFLATTKKASGFNGLGLLVILVVIALIIWAVVRANRSSGPRHIDSGFSTDDFETDSFEFDDDSQTFDEPPPSGDARMDALAKAVDLYGKGFLTDEEFNAEKQRILEEPS